jgi:archaemetzincin
MKIFFYFSIISCIILKDFFNFSKEKIYILPMGDVNELKISSVKKDISKFYKLDVETLPKIKLIRGTKISDPEKYDAYKILKHVNSNYKHIDGKILVLTNVDICNTKNLKNCNKNNNNLGLAFVGLKPCIVSTKKIKSNEKLSKVSIHELGHTFGLKHCKHSRCLMSKPKCVDCNEIWMCNDCKKKLF